MPNNIFHNGVFFLIPVLRCFISVFFGYFIGLIGRTYLLNFFGKLGCCNEKMRRLVRMFRGLPKFASPLYGKTGKIGKTIKLPFVATNNLSWSFQLRISILIFYFSHIKTIHLGLCLPGQGTYLKVAAELRPEPNTENPKKCSFFISSFWIWIRSLPFLILSYTILYIRYIKNHGYE